jgi:hypothetical protein
MTIIPIGLIVACLSINACNDRREAHPATSLQRMLASRLLNPDMCPTGDSQDVQQIVNAADSAGIAHLPEASYWRRWGKNHPVS